MNKEDNSLNKGLFEKAFAEYCREIFISYFEMMFFFERCYQIANTTSLTDIEICILVTVRVNSVSSFNDLNIVLNKHNKLNMTYLIKKLLKLKLLNKINDKGNKKNVYYNLTEFGINYVESYQETLVELRNKVFSEENIPQLNLTAEAIRNIRVKFEMSSDPFIYKKAIQFNLSTK